MEKTVRNRRQRNRLTPALVRKLVADCRRGRHADGGNLYLAVSPNGSARWVFLYRWRDTPEDSGPGAPREKGLGSITTVTLQQARRQAAALRTGLRKGISPLPLRAARKPISERPMGSVRADGFDVVTVAEGEAKSGDQNEQVATSEPAAPPIRLKGKAKGASRSKLAAGQLALFDEDRDEQEADLAEGR